jgi:hypothetical protein
MKKGADDSASFFIDAAERYSISSCHIVGLQAITANKNPTSREASGVFECVSETT